MSSSLLVRAVRVSAARSGSLSVAARSSLALFRHASTATATSLKENLETDEFLTDGATTASAAFAAPRTEKPAAPENPNAHNPEFASLKGQISDDTLRAITGKALGGLKYMSDVQAAVLPLVGHLAEPHETRARASAGGEAPPPRDLLVKAKTGTGKTLGFLVPAVEARLRAIEHAGKQAVRDAGLDGDRQLEARARRAFARSEVGTLIISPTRELATQIANEAIKLTQHHEGFEVRLFVGGMSKRNQMRDWTRGRRDIVVATPGRLRDLLESEEEIRNGISKSRQLILDEADTLLDMGFRDDLDAIVKHLPESPARQTFLFSATVPRSVQQIARATLDRNHAFITCAGADDSPVHAHVPQFHTTVPTAAHQIPHLLRLLAHDQLVKPGGSKIIVFLPTTKMTQLFATLLRELAPAVLPAGKHTAVYEIHSKRTQDQRTSTSDRFRADKSGAAILVTSDVSARGVDYPGVSRVVQVGVPAGTEQYVHRVGRTGRGGSTEGRGDLVLLPWEAGFVNAQLSDVPMKALKADDLAADLAQLADKYDADPRAAFAGVPTADTHAAKYDRSARRVRGPQPHAAPVVPRLAEIERAVEDLLQQVDGEAVRETMMSMLGYYMSKSGELRAQRAAIVQGVKDWTVGACGLPAPPFLSERFLRELGMDSRPKKQFGRAFRPEPSFGRGGGGGASWDQRGNAPRRSGGFGGDRGDRAESGYSKGWLREPRESRGGADDRAPRRSW